MTTLGSYNMTFGEIAKRLEHENGSLATIVEMLSQSNEIMDDIVTTEGNIDTGLRTTLRTGIPQGTWRKAYQGTQPGRSTATTVDVRTAQLAARIQIDCDVADLGGRRAALMADETRAYMEGLTQQMAGALFYENQTTNPERITGLSQYYNSTTAESGDNLVRAGGAGSDNASIWFLGWHPDALTVVTPKGLPGGLKMEDLGKRTVYDTAGVAGAAFEAYEISLKWNIGLALRDWRQCVRIANIDVSNAEGGTDPGLNKLMADAIERVDNINKGKFAFYMNKTMRRLLSTFTRAEVKTGGGLNYENVQGKRVMMFQGFPVRIVDQLLNTESTVS